MALGPCDLMKNMWVCDVSKCLPYPPAGFAASQSEAKFKRRPMSDPLVFQLVKLNLICLLCSVICLAIAQLKIKTRKRASWLSLCFYFHQHFNWGLGVFLCLDVYIALVQRWPRRKPNQAHTVQGSLIINMEVLVSACNAPS